MNKRELLDRYPKEEDKLLISKVLDKINFTKIKNKISYTDFLDMYEQEVVSDILNKLHEKSYVFYGGFEEAERKILIIYPEKFINIGNKENINVNIEKIVSQNNILKIIRIKLPEELEDKYSHRNYLGAIMKLGVKREKIGDIVVDKTGADIIISDDICKFLVQNLSSLKRFSKSNIEEIKINSLKKVNIEREKIKIIVNSLRIDSIVSELLRISRSKANEIILEKRVVINFKNVIKPSKELSLGDKITIRGKGRFEIIDKLKTTKNGKSILSVEKIK